MAMLLNYQTESPTRARVYRYHYKPHKLPQDQVDAGLLLDSEEDIPEAQPLPRQAAVLYVNPEDGSLWWEYVERELTPEEQIADLQELMDVMLGGGEVD